MADYPTISIVTPCLNEVAFVERTMRSVFDQGYPQVEYIVMDGGSTDGTLDVVRKYADRLAYWESGPDGGQYQAILKGLERSTGDLVATGGKLSMIDAAAIVLEAAVEPMTCGQIIQKATETTAWQPGTGLTPANTLSAAMRREIKVKGDTSRFQLGDRGKFAIKK